MIFMENGIIIIEIGRKIFHLNFISISYRKRGYVPRTHSSVIVIMINVSHISGLYKNEKNIRTLIILRIIMLMYSARKINANHPPIYSTLNPDTSSDSPSAKSNGLRLVSAKQVIIQIANRVIFPKKNGIVFCDIEMLVNE